MSSRTDKTLTELMPEFHGIITKNVVMKCRFLTKNVVMILGFLTKNRVMDCDANTGAAVRMLL